VSKIRIMHYMNQFFAGIGGEDKAGVPLGYREGSVGPGKRLRDLIGPSAEIVVTVYCGDDFFPDHQDEVVKEIIEIARTQGIQLVVAGPAFGSGRHGYACVEVCQALGSTLGLNCVTGMHPENPGIGRYKHYRNSRVFAFPTSGVVSGMEDALQKMAGAILRLGAGRSLGPSKEEGYIRRGIRVEEFVDKCGAERAVDMLLGKMAGSLATEIPVERFEPASVAPPVENLHRITLALGTTAGIVPRGNPDGFKFYRNNHWRKYSLEKLNSMKEAAWDAVHGGYNTAFMRENPNFGVPLDVCRELEKEGSIAKLHGKLYVTTGVLAQIPDMERVGKEMAEDMTAQGVNGVLLVST
jgi:glycine reductase complex component B subunit gamma